MITHIKTHIVGYLALFLVLGGGTAYANHLQVFSSDIVDGQVFGVDVTESTLSVPDMGCQTGKIRGYARVKGSDNMLESYETTTTFIDRTNNCSNGSVQVRRASTGLYFVRFLGNSSTLATVVSNSDNEGVNGSGNDNIVSVGRIVSGADAGAFRVEVEDVGDHSNGSDATDGWFTIALI
jgi:hypothetical protein